MLSGQSLGVTIPFAAAENACGVSVGRLLSRAAKGEMVCVGTPNASHPTTIAQSTRIPAGYLLRPALGAVADPAAASAKVLARN
jgi:hypothetical protein